MIVRFLHNSIRAVVAVTIAIGAWCSAANPVSSDLPPIHYRLARSFSTWLPYWMDKGGDGAGWKDIEAHANDIDEVSFFDFAADPTTGNISNEGEMHGMDPATLFRQVAWLHTHDVAALFTVTQFNHVDQMLSDPVRLQHLIHQIEDTSERYGFDGVDIDFEDFKPGDPSDSQRYTSFIEQLSLSMHAHLNSFEFPSIVEATVLPHTNRGTFAFVDYASLANSDVDRIRVMAYDENYAGSKLAGASAPAPWVASVATYLSSINGPQWKFVLGMPGYGYRWPVNSGVDWTTTGRGQSTTYAAAQNLMLAHNVERKWSDGDRSPYFGYMEGGKTWIAFYEDAESWQTKLQTVLLPSRMNGVAEWAAGFEDPNSWTIIEANLAASEHIYGVIGSCYWRYGGGAKFGDPLATEEDAGPAEADTLNLRGGRVQRFANCNIYYRWNEPRAYVVEDKILTAYLAAGGPSGSYGFPIGDVTVAENGAASQAFEKGTITQP